MASDAEIAHQLAALAQAETGDINARVNGLVALPGHAGQSYSFELAARSADGRAEHEKLVLRLAPAGVRIAGPADVVRQARIMQSLAGTLVPVPPIKWTGDDPRWFGRPFFVAGFVAGDKLALGDHYFGREEQRVLAQATVEVLAALHGQPWESSRGIWGDPLTLADEMVRLDSLLDRPTLEPKVVGRAPELRERMRATFPPAPQIGFVHGDLQWSNCLYGDGRVFAVIDWELSQIGAVLIDPGWLCFFSDRETWGTATDLVPEHVPEPDELAEIYRNRVAWPVTAADVRWFRAFAGYRFGVITAFNLMLHRRGKRPDPTWEDIAVSAPRMFERALELVG